MMIVVSSIIVFWLRLAASEEEKEELFASSATEALGRLRRAMPHVDCRSSLTPAKRVACAEGEFVERLGIWLEWQVAFRGSRQPCSRWCSQALSEVRFVYQGQKRLRKGYGNHVFASLNALLGAILTNRSAVLGLDEATRELNTPHLLWDDESVWSARSLRARYLSCACQSAKGIKNMRADAPLWHTQKQIAHLSGIAPDERWPLAVDPAGPDGLGLAKTLGSFFTRVPYRTQTVGSDCGEDRGDHFLKRGFEELASLPNVYGILAYAFSRPTDDLARFVTAQHRHNASFAIGTHVRVNLHVGTSTHGASTLVGKEKAWRMEPLKQAWANMLTQHHLPKLAQSLSESTFLFVSDQPKVAAGLSAALGRGASHFDAVAADDAMRRVTNDEKSRPFMIHSADWGNSPRWASLAELFILSTSTRAVVCSGPYSPSTFCELAASIAAIRRALRRPRDGGTHDGNLLVPSWRIGYSGSPSERNQDPATATSLFWCPEFSSKGTVGPTPRCCESVVLPDD